MTEEIYRTRHSKQPQTSLGIGRNNTYHSNLNFNQFEQNMTNLRLANSGWHMTIKRAYYSSRGKPESKALKFSFFVFRSHHGRY